MLGRRAGGGWRRAERLGVERSGGRVGVGGEEGET